MTRRPDWERRQRVVVDGRTVAIAHVRQEDAYGCGPACLAMLTCHSYREVRDWFRVRAWENAQRDGRNLEGDARDAVELHDFTRWGVTHFEMEHYLAAHGYATARVFSTMWTGTPREPWPPEPFADAHLCAMDMPNGTHYVVWLRDGRVLDPAAGETTLSDPRFGRLGYAIGVCRMGGMS